MSKPITAQTIQAMTSEQVAELNRQLTKKAIRNIVIFVGVKLAIYYGIHRLVKAAAESK